jgi:hypothetical protein
VSERASEEDEEDGRQAGWEDRSCR